MFVELDVANTWVVFVEITELTAAILLATDATVCSCLQLFWFENGTKIKFLIITSFIT